MRIVLVANPKGGVGKSSISVGLAAAWAQLGLRACIIDCDSPQFTAAHWLKGNTEGVETLVFDDNNPGLGPILGRMRAADAYDVVVVDTPARSAESTWAAAAMADTLLIPVKQGGSDIQQAGAMLANGRQFPADRRIVFNEVYPSPAIMAEIMPLAQSLGVQLCNIRLPRRVTVPRAQLHGKPVTSFQPRGAAAQEIFNLAREVLQLWENQHPTPCPDGETLTSSPWMAEA